jgi:hypothetical protein
VRRNGGGRSRRNDRERINENMLTLERHLAEITGVYVV